MKTYSGEQLLLLRTKKKLSQGGVASKMGISQPTYSRIEKKTEVPAERVEKILQALNASFDELDKWRQ